MTALILRRWSADDDRCLLGAVALGMTFEQVTTFVIAGRTPDVCSARWRGLQARLDDQALEQMLALPRGADDRDDRAAKSPPARPLAPTFEQQLERVRNGAPIAAVRRVPSAAISITLGGVSAGLL